MTREDRARGDEGQRAGEMGEGDRKELRETNKKMKLEETDAIKAAIQKKKLPAMFLSEEQQHVLKLVTEFKKSVFFTGSAGTWLSLVF